MQMRFFPVLTCAGVYRIFPFVNRPYWFRKNLHLELINTPGMPPVLLAGYITIE